jgi:disulfide bond formation protein DsbB
VREAILVVAMVAALLAVMAIPAESGIIVGGAISLASLAIGAVAGLVYHVVLHRTLAPRGTLRRGWFWHPTDYHKDLDESQRVRVLPWFVVGAAGFVGSIFGCLVVVTAVVRSL